MIDIDVLNRTRSAATEYRNKYIQISPYLLEAYTLIRPYSLSILSHVLLYRILENKEYSSYSSMRKTMRDETKRIYSTLDMRLEDIISCIYPNIENLECEKSNIRRRIKELEDMNIFYYWRYRQEYIFIMEREIGCWKCLNEGGVVIPKTLLKILNLSESIIDCMRYFCTRRNIEYNSVDAEKSFSEFLEKLISKMDVEVAKKIRPRNDIDFSEFIVNLKQDLSKLNAYEGLVESKTFIGNLSTGLRYIIEHRRNQEAERKQMKENESNEADNEINEAQNEQNEQNEQNDLLPKNPCIGGKVKYEKVRKSIKVKDVVEQDKETPKQKKYVFNDNVDPFLNARIFTEYYRAYIKTINNRAKLDGFSSDVRNAGIVMDLLIENNRSDKLFLNSWLKFYCENSLKGNKIFNTKYTSLYSFGKTFDQYKNIYYVPQKVV